MKKIKLTSNKLKIIAIVTMIIDHIGYYFYYLLNDNIYLLCRIIGRISMPLFVFLLIEGYLHTKNYIKYVNKVAIFAIITQLFIFLLTYINKIYVPNYNINISSSLNILFSFVFILLF
ncbi:MAG: TraX family protein, partial [Clostridia bacterium]